MTSERQYNKGSRLWAFLRTALVIFFLLFVAFTLLGLTPIPVTEINNSFFSLFIKEASVPEGVGSQIDTPEVSVFVTKTENGTRPTNVARPVVVSEQSATGLPKSISIPAIGLSTTILNPQSETVAGLDAALLKGAVRYPTSGTFSVGKTMFLMGHSSYLPVVYNQEYKAFNEIQTLLPGQDIYVRDGSSEYHYRVVQVNKVKAEDTVITVKNDRGLVLSTCNSFASKDDRFVVYADFVKSYSFVN